MSITSTLEQHPQLVRVGDDASIRGDGVGLGGGGNWVRSLGPAPDGGGGGGRGADYDWLISHRCHLQYN